MTSRSDTEKFIKEFWLFFAATAIGSGVFFVVEKSMNDKLVSLLIATVVALILCLLAIARFYSKKYNLIGVKEVYDKFDVAPSTLDIISKAEISVDFIGISGRTFFESSEIEEIIKRKVNSGVKFRFLIVNPESKFVEEKALDEGDDPKAWIHDIQASIARLNGLKSQIANKQSNNGVLLKIYDALPIWRGLFIDNKYGYVTYYPHGKRGKQSQVLHLVNSIGKLYSPIFDQFNYFWNYTSKQL